MKDRVPERENRPESALLADVVIETRC